MLAAHYWLWLLTQLVDYSGCFLLAYLCYFLHTSENVEIEYPPLQLALVLAVQGAAAAYILYLRERVHFWLLEQFRSSVSKPPAWKSPSLTSKSLRYIFQTTAFSQHSFFWTRLMGYTHHDPYQITGSFWGTQFLQFYTLLVLRDFCFLLPLHTKMHAEWYHLHKTHHEPTRNLQAMHAFYIDLVDLFVENAGAPFLLLTFQRLCGSRIGFHWLVGVLLTCHDASLHSINPYSTLYFNLLLDWRLKGNICHQLHHALNKGYLLFAPYQHWFSDKRQLDIDRYNRIFQTSYKF